MLDETVPVNDIKDGGVRILPFSFIAIFFAPFFTISPKASWILNLHHPLPPTMTMP